MFKYTINYSTNYSINYFMCVKFIKQRSFISILKLNMEEEGGRRSFSMCNYCIFKFCISLNSGRRKRKYWVRDYFRGRDQYGAYKLTLEELRLKDPF